MNFQEAIREYQANPTKENLHRQTEGLLSAMTLKERIHMLSGHTLWVTQKHMIKEHRTYNYEGLPMGGCQRLGVPPAKFSDGPRGVVMANSTCFPVSMCRASAFDDELEFRVAQAMAREIRAQGANYFAGICINLVRNPRWGRAQESFGEDPFLLGKLGVAQTRAVQAEGVTACPKHFACNSIEDLRFLVNVTAEERTLREVYLPHFKKCIDAGALSIMAAYNRLNEIWCCENKWLLTDVLRNEWGFEGYVISDFVFGVHDAERSLRAGLDIEMMFTMKFAKINSLLKKGLINSVHIDRAVRNILGVLIRMVPLEKSYDLSVVVSKEHTDLAREVAEKGIVLLKNNGVLPLAKGTKVAVVGDYADVVNVGDNGSSKVYSPYTITHYQGIKALFPDAVAYTGTPLLEALEAAKDAEVVIVTAGSNSAWEGEALRPIRYSEDCKTPGVGGDRMSLRLAPEEIALIQGLHKAGKKVVVALFSGCAILTSDFSPFADAILLNYYSGLEGGNAFANLVSGKVNPSGKLPFSIANEEKDYPDFLEVGQKPYEIEYGYYHGYTLFDKRNIRPEYPFGFGLSYTSFAIRHLQITDQGDSLRISVEVTNQGQVGGADVVQVYVGSNGASEDRPLKLLKGFQRLELAPQTTQTASIDILKEDMKFFDSGTHRWVIDQSYTIFVGDDSKNAMNLKQTIEL